MLLIGLDDTDTLESRGTGHLARQIAATLSVDDSVLGVTRHQLLFDPRVPYTAKNSSAAIALKSNGHLTLDALAARVEEIVRRHFNPGSDPGLCVARAVPAAIVDFGRRAQRELVTQAEARAVAAIHGIRLIGLGGSQDGVIGALAAVGLAASGEDGRYVQVGQLRELSGLHPVATVLAAGAAAIQTLDGQWVTEGLVLTDRLRPARRGGRPIVIVENAGDYWRPLKLD